MKQRICFIHLHQKVLKNDNQLLMVLHWQITHLILSGDNTKTLFVHGLLHIENIIFTAFPRKVVRKNVHATILKGNMGHDQHSVPDTVAVEFSIVAFV